MKNSEYYTIEENWPQPPDDSCTLDNAVQQGSAPAHKKKKKSSAKAKKKMSESLAGVTAAAVAVVMLSTSIPVLRDAFDDFPELPDFDVGGDICPVCSKEECPYYYDGDPGLWISLGSEAQRSDSDDLYSMRGFVEDTERYYFVNYPCVFTSSGQRIVMRLTYDYTKYFPVTDSRDYPLSSEYAEYGESNYSGLLLVGDDEKSPGQRNYFYAVVNYNADGTQQLITPEVLLSDHSYIDIDPSESNYRVREIPNVPNAQLQVFSDLDDALLEELINCIDIDVVEGQYNTYDLGETMRFTEYMYCYRDYKDFEYSKMSSSYGFNYSDGEERRSLCLDFLTKTYHLRIDYEVNFCAAGWKAVFDRWRDLNENAVESGHQVYFPVEELQSYSINGIEYTCYIAYTTEPVDDVNGYPWIWYYFVPKQERTIAITDHRSISPEMLKKLLETLDVETAVPPEDILSRITLR